MAIAKMKKLQAFAHKSDTDKLVRKLTKLRCLDVETVDVNDYTDDSGACMLKKLDIDDSKVQIEAGIARINDAFVSLHKYDERKHGLFGNKTEVDLDVFAAGEDYKTAWDTVNETVNVQKRLVKIKTEYAELENQRDALYMWLDYELPVSFTGTKSTSVIMGCLPAQADTAALLGELGEYMAELEEVSNDTSGIYISVIVHNNDYDSVQKVLASYGFLKITMNSGAKSARLEYSQTIVKLEKLDSENEKLIERLKELAGDLEKVEILFDCEKTTLGSVLCKQKFLRTSETVMVTGWVPADRQSDIEGLLDSFSCAYEMVDPNADEDAPILLKNNKFAKNFEWVLTMYAFPKYGRFDPTFIMSIFFTIIFGVMFADVGYGLILILGGFGAVFLFKLKGTIKNFMTMFGICGVSSFIMGILFGSYFGDMPTVIMQKYMGIANPPQLFIAFDPVTDVIKYIALALAIGLVHMCVGMGIKFYMISKDSSVLDAIFDVGSYWVLFVGLGLLAVNKTAGFYVCMLGVLMLLLTQGRHEKKIGSKIVKGFASLYSMIGYASDLLSYMRIMALGLASAIIAQVVNVLGSLGTSPVAGIIGMTLAFFIGHSINMGLNVLGSFVHTSRLQYIEFFNKFFEDGGREFTPLAQSEEYSTQSLISNK